MKTLSIQNSFLKIEFLAEAGPRITGAYLPSSPENLLADVPDVQWDTPYGVFHIVGGHRLWHSPEAFPRTYVPDNSGLQAGVEAERASLLQPVEAPTGIQKGMDLLLHANQAALTITHTLTNHNPWEVELAPWGITMLPLGGVALLPQQAPVVSEYLPNRKLTLWNYSLWDDPRLALRNDYILVAGKAAEPPLKVGYFNYTGWAGYLRKGVLFAKQFAPQPGLPHVDMDSNVEVYVRTSFLELETLGPLSRLAPGATLKHVETWKFIDGLPQVTDPDEVLKVAADVQARL